MLRSWLRTPYPVGSTAATSPIKCKRHIENVKEATPKCGALHFKVWDKGSTGSKGDADSRDWL